MKTLCIVSRILVLLSALVVSAAASAADPPIDASVGQVVSIPGAAADACRRFDDNTEIRLLIDGIDTGVRAVGCDAKAGFAFRLDRDASPSNPQAAAAAWEVMLGSPWQKTNKDFRRPLTYGVSQAGDDKKPATIASGTLLLQILTPGLGVIGAILVLAVWIGLLVLGKKSALLRDPGNSGAALTQRTYSLGRTQMAWWFAIIMGAYVFLWVITGDIPVLSTQALGLMGVSGATAVSAAGVDAAKGTVLPLSSGSFFDDLLTDASGITLHRFQMLAMTVILGVVFLIHVAAHLTMPEFDGNTLLLLGISSGTYLGLKVPETQVAGAGTNPSTSPAATPATPTSPPSSQDDGKASYTPVPQ